MLQESCSNILDKKTTNMVKIIDPLKDQRWDDFVLNHKDSTIYHHSRWTEIIQKTYHYEPYYFILEDDNSRIKAGIPFFLIKSRITGTRLVSLPFSDFCDVLTDDKDDFKRLFDAVIKNHIDSKASYVEFSLKRQDLNFKGYNFQILDCYRNHVLELSGTLEDLMDKFHKNCIQRNIKKALKSHITVVTGRDERDVKIFYNLYVMTRRNHGLPPQPYRFFQNIWQFLKSKGMIRILISYDENRPVAGVMILHFKDTGYYLYGGCNSNYLEHKPNHLLLWKAIEICYQKGQKYFDFGRTSVENQGLMDFKRRWGTVEYKLPYYYYSNSIRNELLVNRSTRSHNFISKVLKRMPIPLLRLGGTLIYGHIG